jgi:hypothetical protein
MSYSKPGWQVKMTIRYGMKQLSVNDEIYRINFINRSFTS